MNKGREKVKKRQRQCFDYALSFISPVPSGLSLTLYTLFQFISTSKL